MKYGAPPAGASRVRVLLVSLISLIGLLSLLQDTKTGFAHSARTSTGQGFLRENASKICPSWLRNALPGGLAILHFKTMGVEPSWVLILTVCASLRPFKIEHFHLEGRHF